MYEQAWVGDACVRGGVQHTDPQLDLARLRRRIRGDAQVGPRERAARRGARRAAVRQRRDRRHGHDPVAHHEHGGRRPPLARVERDGPAAVGEIDVGPPAAPAARIELVPRRTDLGRLDVGEANGERAVVIGFATAVQLPRREAGEIRVVERQRPSVRSEQPPFEPDRRGRHEPERHLLHEPVLGADGDLVRPPVEVAGRRAQQEAGRREQRRVERRVLPDRDPGVESVRRDVPVDMDDAARGGPDRSAVDVEHAAAHREGGPEHELAPRRRLLLGTGFGVGRDEGEARDAALALAGGEPLDMRPVGRLEAELTALVARRASDRRRARRLAEVVGTERVTELAIEVVGRAGFPNREEDRRPRNGSALVVEHDAGDHVVVGRRDDGRSGRFLAFAGSGPAVDLVHRPRRRRRRDEAVQAGERRLHDARPPDAARPRPRFVRIEEPRDGDRRDGGEEREGGRPVRRHERRVVQRLRCASGELAPAAAGASDFGAASLYASAVAMP